MPLPASIRLRVFATACKFRSSVFMEQPATEVFSSTRRFAGTFSRTVSDDNHGLSGQRFNARGISFTGNVAYNQNLGNQWFVEPSAGIIWSRTRVDALNVPGTGILGTPVGPGFVPPWVLTVNDIDSVLGRFSVRAGTTITSGDVVWQPFASASVFHEFRGGVTSSLSSNFSALGPAFAAFRPSRSTVTASRPRDLWPIWPGLRGAGGGHDLDQLFARQTIGRETTSKAGASTAACATNLSPIPRPDIHSSPRRRSTKHRRNRRPITGPVSTSVRIWEPDWGSSNFTFLDDGATTYPRFAGFLGGGEIGYNYQVGKWVLGAEGDLAWANAHGARPCPIGFFANCEIDMNWLSTVTGRIGYAYWDRLLTYVKAGTAIAQDRAAAACTVTQPTCRWSGVPPRAIQDQGGRAAGAGAEFGLTRNVSVKSEITYFDLGSDRYTLAGIPTDIKRNGFISTLGVHVRIGG